MKNLIAGVVLLAMASPAWSDLELPSVFSDGAVFQCGRAVPVWGWWDQPGDPVCVTFAGQTVTTDVRPDGSWRVTLAPVEASYRKHVMVTTVGTETLRVENILVGEVWLCSGQSNMQSSLGFMSQGTRDEGYESVVEFMKQEKDTAQDEHLRHFNVPNRAAFIAAERDVKGRWVSVSPQSNEDITAAGYFFAKELRKVLDRPVGLLNSTWGGQRIDGFIPPSKLKSPSYDEWIADVRRKMESYDPEKAEETFQNAYAQWEAAVKAARAAGAPRPWPPRRSTAPDASPGLPGAIYNGMIHPLVPYAIRGMLWYQGESHNHSKPETYGGLLRQLISGLREEWGQGDFPVYFCQLANLTPARAEPLSEKNSRVVVSNQIRRSLKIPNTGMAVLHDIGQVIDIHPRNKLDVGLRLSRLALNKTYGFEDIVPSGPLYRSCAIKGSSIIVTFDYTGSGLMVGEKHLLDPVTPSSAALDGFEICGEDGEWMRARARIVSRNKVEVSLPSIGKPVAVRYAWQQNPANANLYNKEGLPTALFTSLK